MNKGKGIYPCIWLLKGKAVRGFDNDEIISEDPADLVRSYAASGADGVILFDRSKSDADHEAAIDLIRKICEEGGIPVIGAGNIRRMEDVKKLIYAGCDMAALNLSKESNRLLAREVCERFGKDRIAGCYRTTENLDKEWAKLAPWLSMRILLDAENAAPAEDGAEKKDQTAGDSDQRDEAAGAETIPVIDMVEDASGEALSARLAGPQTAAVSGNGVNRLMTEGQDTVEKLRAEFQSEGIPMEDHKKAAFAWEDFKKGPDGLLPVVVQEEATDQVLMVAYMNEEAYNLTVETGKMTYYSRSRQSLWIKGETSGHFQYVRSLYGDCDMDTLLARVEQFGAACHTGSHSCFFQSVVQDEKNSRMQKAEEVLRQDYETILDRKEHPAPGSYTNYLFDKGIDKMLKKLGEEATEIVIAAKNPNPNEIVYEIADYLYHLMVVMAEKGLTWDDVTAELVRRQKKD